MRIMSNNYLHGEIGDRIVFETQTVERGGKDHKAIGKIIAVYPKYFLVQTPFGYKATVSRIVNDKEEENAEKKGATA